MFKIQSMESLRINKNSFSNGGGEQVCEGTPLISSLGRQSQAALCEDKPGLHREICFHSTNNKRETRWHTPSLLTSGSLRHVELGKSPNIRSLEMGTPREMNREPTWGGRL